MSLESSTVPWTHSEEVIETPRFVEPNEAFDATHEILCRKWHTRIVYRLLEDGPMGFSALKDSLVGISSKMLSESLTTLQEDGIVHREIINDQPIRVNYSLTERGVALEPVLSALLYWGTEYGPAQEEA